MLTKAENKQLKALVTAYSMAEISSHMSFVTIDKKREAVIAAATALEKLLAYIEEIT